MCLKLGHFPFSELSTGILLLFGFPTFELQLGPNSFNVGQKFKLPILTRLSSVRWLAVDLWISEQEINGINPPLWAKYYSSSSFRKKHLSFTSWVLRSISLKDEECFGTRDENVENDVFYGFTDQSKSEQSRAKNVLMEKNIKARDLLPRCLE